MNRQRCLNFYVWTVVALGLAACVYSASRLRLNSLGLDFYLLALVTIVITSRISIKIPRLSSHITVSDTFVFLTMLLYGGDAAVLVAAADALCFSSRISKKPRTLLLNLSILSIATFLTGQARLLYLGADAASAVDFSAVNLVALCLMVFVQYIVNSGLAATYEALKSDQPLWQTWHKHYLWTSITYIVGASGAAITAKVMSETGFYTILVTTPLIGVLYFTYRTYLKNLQTAETQAEQARQHVEELSHYIAEQERIREQFSQVEKMSALGVLASGVAHDFNNTLAAILGRAELMMRHNPDPKMTRGLEIIIKSSQDGAKIVKRIQDFARQRRDNNFAPVAVDQMLLDVSEITRPRWKDQAEARNVQINLDLRNKSSAFLMGDASELRDVLVNIVFNAVDAMPEGGCLTLSSEVSDGQVVISVGDTGTGMSSDVSSRIFDPFFTTKGVEGMGLGLAVSYGVVRRHEGTIEVESEIGRGSIFRLKLPRAEGAGDNQTGAGSAVRATPEQRLEMTKILVVDDEKHVRELLSEILEELGYDVVVASSGHEGLAIFETRSFDAVFTDVGMPGMSGWELARAIRERQSHIPVAVITGWGEAVSTDEKESARVDWVLTKPFSMAQIEEIAQEVSRRRLIPPANVIVAEMVV